MKNAEEKDKTSKKQAKPGIEKIISRELSIKPSQTEAVIKLIDEGNTIPFIARYRKEATGNLNDEVLRAFEERLKYLRGLWDRKTTVLQSIDEQGRLTTELEREINEAESLVKLEDIYRPYKQKKRTRASVAKEKGLKPLADFISSGGNSASLSEEAKKYISSEKDVNSADEAIAGASDIIAEEISDNAVFRQHIRRAAFEKGVIAVSAKDESVKSVYEMYYSFSEPVKRLAGHRILAIDRGEKEKVLIVKLSGIDDDSIEYLKSSVKKEALKNRERICGAGRLPSDTEKVLSDAAEDAYRRLIAPSIENEIRGELTDKAQAGAIKVFAENLRQLLMQPPVAGKTVLGWDPAFRTGCKLAVADSTGKILYTTVIYPTAPQNKVEESLDILRDIIKKYKVDVISLGNGTASRESESVIAKLGIPYVIVNEAGASVYSASKAGAEEFPEFDVGQRSAASIARRLEDPLSELVKIEPESIGVGQYQHDLNRTKLSETLENVVEDCVNSVGVDLNTASAALLCRVSGISKTVAKNIVVYRQENGGFKTRRELLKVPKLGPKAFEQSAGFMRIRGGSEPLDATAVHPESYEAAEKLLAILGIPKEELSERIKNAGPEASGSEKITKGSIREAVLSKRGGISELSKELGIGEYTLSDIADELERPGRDPRDDMPKPLLKSDVLEIEDLKPGMLLKGTVRNITDFGAFVDIGVHQDGLVHISELSDRFVKHPMDVVKVGQVVDVRVISADCEKKRISLSMKNAGK